ncbi:hypothetical protein PIB30_073041, partial [Stylosanthes scabra]|nr:hypothetical protein [Stylosanthes scabra]
RNHEETEEEEGDRDRASLDMLQSLTLEEKACHVWPSPKLKAKRDLPRAHQGFPLRLESHVWLGSLLGQM